MCGELLCDGARLTEAVGEMRVSAAVSELAVSSNLKTDGRLVELAQY